MGGRYPLFIPAKTIYSRILTPDGAVSTATPVVTWIGGPGVQVSYRYRIYSDIALLDLVYDTGIVASALLTFTIPGDTLVSGVTYYQRIDQVFADGLTGDSIKDAPVSFTATFATVHNVMNVRALAFGDKCGYRQNVLPGIELSWPKVVVDSGETFVSYQIRRRIPPSPGSGTTSSYSVIATITDVNTITYDDYTVGSDTVYEYKVIYIALDGSGNTRTSMQSRVAGYIEFDYFWIHDLSSQANAKAYNARLFQFDSNQKVNQPNTVRIHAGRSKPTIEYQEALYETITVPGLDQYRRDPKLWKQLMTLVDRQRTFGITLCARNGRSGLKWYVGITNLGKGESQKTYAPTLEMTETFFDESCT